MKLKPQFLFDCFDPLKNVAVKVTIKDLEDHFQLKNETSELPEFEPVYPAMNWKKPTIQKWLDSKGVKWHEDDTKKELLEKIEVQNGT